MSKEIELKYLVTPEEVDKVLDKYCVKSKGIQEISQYYTQSTNGTYNTRFRKLIDNMGNHHYIRTTKTGTGIEREELEEVVPFSEYYDGCEKIVVLEKVRKIFELNINDKKYVLELDYYTNQLYKDLLIAELEFSTLEEALEFRELNIFSNDVTDSGEYSNSKLWLKLQGGSTDADVHN